jgi:hypothetical protein
VHKVDLNGTEAKIPVSIERKAFDTALGMVSTHSEEFPVARRFAKRLQQLPLQLQRFRQLSEKQRLTDSEKKEEEKIIREVEAIEDAYEKGLHKKLNFSSLGLRRLIYHKANVIKFSCNVVVR